MKITITGTGYVGLVTGACLAEVSNAMVSNNSHSNRPTEVETLLGNRDKANLGSTSTPTLLQLAPE